MGAGRTWVMLVEDDPAVADVYRLGLELNGFDVTVAGSGEELFRSLDGRAPDVFVLDYHLPGANGADVLESIRKDPRTARAMVFMLSNFPSTQDGVIDRVVGFGAMAWLEKVKTSPSTLAERLAEALRLRGGSLPAGSHTSADAFLSGAAPVQDD